MRQVSPEMGGLIRVSLALQLRLISHRLNAHKLPFFLSIADNDFFFVHDCPLGQAIEGDSTAKDFCL
jgi:hypothetical protein